MVQILDWYYLTHSLLLSPKEPILSLCLDLGPYLYQIVRSQYLKHLFESFTQTRREVTKHH